MKLRHWPFTLLSLTSLATVAHAYSTFPYADGPQTLYEKWGTNQAGTTGGTVAWSLIPAATPGSAYCGTACASASVGSLHIEIAPGAGFADATLESLRPRLRAVFARWAHATGIRFVELGSDSGVAINDAAAVPPGTGQIRIGAFAFSSGGGAVGYAPPPNGGTGAGDILFDANSYYQFAPDAEGAPFDTTYAPNDVESLLLHEMGHALGLAHPPYDGSCPVMQVAAPCLGRVNRQLDADDIAGVQFLYGSLFSDGFDD